MTKLNKSNIGVFKRLTRDRVEKAMSNYKNQKATDPAYGIVKAIKADGSYMVQLNASSTLTRCAPCCTAMVGDRVLVLIKANGKCDAIGRLGGELAKGTQKTEQATFYDSSAAWVEETSTGWITRAFDEARAKTSGFDAVAKFVGGEATFLKDGCYELSGSAYFTETGGELVGIGVFNGDEEEYSAFSGGATAASVALPPCLVNVAAGDTRTLKRRVAAGFISRLGGYTWFTIKYVGPGSEGSFTMEVDSDGNLYLIYEGSVPKFELDSSGNLYVIYDGDKPVFELEANGDLYYIV